MSGTIKLERIYVMEVWQPDHHNHLLPCRKDQSINITSLTSAAELSTIGEGIPQ